MDVRLRPEMEEFIARDLGGSYTRQDVEEKIVRGLAQIERG